MTRRRIGLADITPLAVRARHVGELLLTKCGNSTLGEHIWRATRDMTPGPRAQNTDPDTGGWTYEEIIHPDGTIELMPVANDAVGEAAVTDPGDDDHLEYRQILDDLNAAIDAAEQFIANHRPDRSAPLPQGTSEADWCRNHLHTIGVCEPRYRGDLCRFCYDAQLAYGVEPPATLLRMKHERSRISQADFDSYMTAAKKRHNRKRKRR